MTSSQAVQHVGLSKPQTIQNKVQSTAGIRYLLTKFCPTSTGTCLDILFAITQLVGIRKGKTGLDLCMGKSSIVYCFISVSLLK